MRLSFPKCWSDLLLASFLALGSGAALAQEGGFTAPVDADGAVSIPVADLGSLVPEQGLQIFVGPASACCEGRAPISGTYAAVGDAATFTPAFPFVDGQVYTVLLRGKAKQEFIVGPEGLPVRPEVLAVYPSGQVIPENTLRFYIEFASPMQPHRAEEFISLEDADGRPDREAFMSFKQELWNHDRTRLTLLMDPGRIKRGVATNLELGPALESGHRYTLVVGAGWPAASGQGVTAEHRSAFDIGDPLRSRPDTGNWAITAPRLGTTDPLELRFDRAFDRVQLRHSITVSDARGQRIPGSMTPLEHETAVSFVPAEVWRDSEVFVSVDATLEDVAGNNFREVLDHPVGTPARALNNVTLKVVLTAP